MIEELLAAPEVLCQNGTGSRMNGDQARTTLFRTANRENGVFNVDVIQFKAHCLPDAHARDTE